jgi:hypothetical protein
VAGAASAILALVIYLSYRVTRSLPLTGAVALVAIACGSPMFNAFQPTWPAVALALAGAVAGIAYFGRPRPAWALATGVLIGTATIFKHQFLLVAVPWLALAIFTALKERRRLAPALAAFGAGFALPVTPVVIWLFARGAVAAAWHDSVVFPLTGFAAGMAIPLPGVTLPEVGVVVGAAAAGVALVRRGAAAKVAGVLVLLVTWGAAAALTRGGFTDAFVRWPFHLPWLGFVAAGVAVVAVLRGQARIIGAAMALSALAIHVQVFPRADLVHLTFSLGASGVAWAAALGPEGTWGEWRSRFAGGITGVLVLAAVPAVLWQLTQFVEVKRSWGAKRLIWDERIWFDESAARFLVKGEEVRDVKDVVTYVRSHTSPADTMVALPVLATLNFIAARDFPGRYNHYAPGYLDRAAEEDELELWRERNLGAAITSTIAVNGRPFDEYCPLLNGYLCAAYEPKAEFGRFTVWLKR